MAIKLNVRTVYFGSGSPTILNEKTKRVDKLKSSFSIGLK